MSDLTTLPIGLALQTTVILGAAITITAVARRLSAEERHLILCAALLALVFLLPATLLLPKRAVPAGSFVDSLRLRANEAFVSVLELDRPARSASDAGQAEAQPRGTDAADRGAALGADGAAPRAIAAARTGRTIASTLYITVAALVLAYFASGWLRIGLRLRSATPATDPRALELARDLSRELALRRRVRLRLGATDRTPWAWGLFRPVVVLPPQFESWSDHERRAALIHELSHVKRFDLLSTISGQLCCALYWWQPLAWVAFGRLRREAEHACDDRVMLGGASTSTYAAQLLSIARAIQRDEQRPPPVPAMAGTFVSRRIKSVLDEGTRRRTVNVYKFSTALAAALLISVPLATLESQPAAPADEAELEMRIESLLDENDAEAARDELARWLLQGGSCGMCVRGLEGTGGHPDELTSLVLDAFGVVEERARQRDDTAPLMHLARICRDSGTQQALDLGVYYLDRAESVGGLDDASKLFAVEYLNRLGQYAAARSIAESLHEDPDSQYHESEVTSNWIAYLETTEERMGRIFSRLTNGSAAGTQEDYMPIFKAAPAYPEQALEQGLEGYAITEYTITPDGTTTDARIIESSSSLFHEATLESVGRYRYMPRLTAGTPVAVHGVQTITRYELPN